VVVPRGSKDENTLLLLTRWVLRTNCYHWWLLRGDDAKGARL